MILSIPLLSGLRSNEKKTTLVCDEKHKCIEFILNKYVDNIIYYNNKKLKHNMLYRLATIRKLKSEGFDEVIHSGISRQQGGADVLAWACSASKTIGFYPRPWNHCEIAISNKWFNKMIDGHHKDIHEIERMEIMAKFFGCKPGEYRAQNTSQTDNIFIVCIGTSSPVREWGIDKFIGTAEKLKNTTGFMPVFVGEKKDLKNFPIHLEYSHINLIGKTTFDELYNLIAKSKFIITNDSSPMHIGVLLNVPTIAIVSGGEYNSYCNYPEKYTDNLLIISSNDKSCYNCGWNCVYKKPDNTPFQCLSKISIEDAISSIITWQKIKQLIHIE
ncbi:MAG: glycosyltransferase family 9 protein [Acidithiobacillus ferrivorans]